MITIKELREKYDLSSEQLSDEQAEALLELFYSLCYWATQNYLEQKYKSI